MIADCPRVASARRCYAMRKEAEKDDEEERRDGQNEHRERRYTTRKSGDARGARLAMRENHVRAQREP